MPKRKLLFDEDPTHRITIEISQRTQTVSSYVGHSSGINILFSQTASRSSTFRRRRRGCCKQEASHEIQSCLPAMSEEEMQMYVISELQPFKATLSPVSTGDGGAPCTSCQRRRRTLFQEAQYLLADQVRLYVFCIWYPQSENVRRSVNVREPPTLIFGKHPSVMVEGLMQANTACSQRACVLTIFIILGLLMNNYY